MQEWVGAGAGHQHRGVIMSDGQDPLGRAMDRMRSALADVEERRVARRGYPTAGRGCAHGRMRSHAHGRRRSRRHRAERPEGGRGSGYVFLAVAAVLVWLVLTGGPWWMLFVALGLGVGGAQRLAAPPSTVPRLLAEAGAETLPPDPEARSAPEPARAGWEVATPPTGALAARAEAACDGLLEELRRAPRLVHDVVRRPEETVRGLRAACLRLARREAEVRALVPAGQDARLAREREALSRRIEAAPDRVVRERLEAARAALDEQRRQHEELTRAASRLEAEQVRLVYTLERLHAQVLRVRSADAGSSEVAGPGLREAALQLGHEIEAVAEALEAVADTDAPPPPLEAPAPGQRLRT